MLQKCLFGGVPESSFQTKLSVAAKTAAGALKQLCYVSGLMQPSESPIPVMYAAYSIGH